VSGEGARLQDRRGASEVRAAASCGKGQRRARGTAGVQAAAPAAVAATAMSQSQPEGNTLQTPLIFPLFFTYWAAGCEWY